MLQLPETARFGRILPKKTLWEKAGMTPALRRYMTEDIDRIRWAYKVSPTTMNLALGKEVKELEVFELRMRGGDIRKDLLEAIDRAIPYHILFLIRKGDEVQAWIAHKTIDKSGKTTLASITYFHTEWMDEKDLSLTIEGLSMDHVYEHFVRQIAGGTMAEDKEESLEDAVAHEKERKKLAQKMDQLERKIKREKQFNRQVELREEYKKLKKQWEAMNG